MFQLIVASLMMTKAKNLHTTNLMEAAMRPYTPMGFEHALDLDSQSVPEISIKGFRLNLERA